MDGLVGGWVDEWKGEWLDGWMQVAFCSLHEWTDRQIYKQVDGQMDEWNGRVDEWMEQKSGWLGGLMDQYTGIHFYIGARVIPQ